MARHEVYANPSAPGWLLDVQSDILSGLKTRVVVPLLPIKDAPLPATRLNPIFEVCGVEASMATQYLSAIPASLLTTPVANVGDKHREIIDALDMLFLGF